MSKAYAELVPPKRALIEFTPSVSTVFAQLQLPLRAQAEFLPSVADYHPATVRVPGPRGADGVPGSNDVLINLPTNATTSGHRVIYVSNAGFAAYPDISIADHGDRIIGVSTAAAELGETLSVKAAGSIEEPGWNWSIGPVYAGDSGLLTQNVPNGNWLRQIGFAVTATRLVIALGPSIRTIPS